MDEQPVKVLFLPSGHRGEVPKGITILEASRRVGGDLEAPCGEKRICGKCVVRVETGGGETDGIESKRSHLSPWREEEGRFIAPLDQERGFRLGCACRVLGDVRVFVPETSRAGKEAVGKKARDMGIAHRPAIRRYPVQTESPGLEDPTGDFERLCKALESEHGLKNLRIDLYALRQLPSALRNGNWAVTVSVWMGKEIVRVRPGTGKSSAYGLALDIGTTTVAGYLCDLSTMAVIDSVSTLNPQCKYGDDVMSRIGYHMTTADGLERMSHDIVEGLNRLIDQIVAGTHPEKTQVGEKKGPDEFTRVSEAGKTDLCLTREDIEDVTIGCNTAMHHILLQLDPEYMGQSPFPPVIHHSLDIKARDIGLRISPGAYVFVLPNEAGFVGADNVGVLIAEEPYKSDEMTLIIDIGTNGELVLGNREKLISASCATGPALEGAHITCGMRAAPGAIERIEIDPVTREVTYQVIGREVSRKDSVPEEIPEEVKVKGICGSGILEVLAEFYRAGVITNSGAFNEKALTGHPRFRKNAQTHIPEFVLAWATASSTGKDVVITQMDIRQIQLAKAALYAGCKLMIERLGGVRLDTVKIAGAFGSQVDPQKALALGLFPDCAPERIIGIGNAAGDGCRVALLDIGKREEADWVARHVEYVELTVLPTFQQAFVEAMYLPHMTDAFPQGNGVISDEELPPGGE